MPRKTLTMCMEEVLLKEAGNFDDLEINLGLSATWCTLKTFHEPKISRNTDGAKAF